MVASEVLPSHSAPAAGNMVGGHPTCLTSLQACYGQPETLTQAGIAVSMQPS